jgi:hypothetical protein
MKKQFGRITMTTASLFRSGRILRKFSQVLFRLGRIWIGALTISTSISNSGLWVAAFSLRIFKQFRAIAKNSAWEGALTNSPHFKAGREGYESRRFFLEEEDAGAKGEEHDGQAGGDAEAGGDWCGTVVSPADDDVAGDGDQEFQYATFLGARR